MKQVKVILKRSLISCTKQQKAAVHCLGLKKIGQSSIVKLNPANKGQIFKIKHLILIEDLTK